MTLSLESPRPDVIRYRVPVKPGLSSDAYAPTIIRLSDKKSISKLLFIVNTLLNLQTAADGNVIVNLTSIYCNELS